MRSVKNLIRLRECAGWSESLLGAHARGYGFWRCESFQQAEYKYWQITVYLFFLYFLENRAGHVIKSFPPFGRNWILSEENWEYISLLIILLISPRVGCMLINKGITLVRPRQAKNCLPAITKCAHAHRPAYTQGLIRVFALHWYIQLYTMILAADCECPDQTAPMHRLIWAFDVRICPKTRFRMARPK